MDENRIYYRMMKSWHALKYLQAKLSAELYPDRLPFKAFLKNKYDCVFDADA